ncbi:hypothetical protein K4F52_006751 [Lecanicillium sp. MT-2017a]|nr:hypothetical protein K4F52_006751 [Lecanicillium sp. MT-2017a]
MSPSRKPVIIVIHGAWHRPVHYINIYNFFRSLDYIVRIPALPSAGHDECVPQKGTDDDVKQVRSVMKEYTDRGMRIVVVCHSYGGFPATDAVYGETVSDREARGEQGGVAAIVYLAAFAPPAAGMSLLSVATENGEKDIPDWWAKKGGHVLLQPHAMENLYSGIPEELARMNLISTVPQSLKSFENNAVRAAAEIAAPKTYIAAEGDLAIPFEGQKGMALAAGAKLEVIPGSHSPFSDPEIRKPRGQHCLTRQVKLAELLLNWIEAEARYTFDQRKVREPVKMNFLRL